MNKIDDLFRATADCVLDTFLTRNGSAGFRIPNYQRPFAWSKENIDRIFEDIVLGVSGLSKNNDPITFIGSVILIEEPKAKEPTFDGVSLSVVDGQQRLTTIALMASNIALRVNNLRSLLEIELDKNELYDWLEKESELLLGNLKTALIGRPGGFAIRSEYELWPRIVREESDVRATTPEAAIYDSPVADYFFQIARFFSPTNHGTEFTYQPKSDGQHFSEFGARKDIIEELIDAVELGASFETEEIPPAESLPGAKTFRQAVFPKIADLGDANKEIIRLAKECKHESVLRLIRLITLGNYMLHRVAITRVEAENEEAAFDIFDSLNTTGEPLTALETFKPLVIRKEQRDSPGGWERSPSHEHLSEIESTIENLPSNDARQRESKQIITLLALFTQGKKIPETLNAQRAYIRTAYERDAEGIYGRRRFVQSFAMIADYRRRFWSKDQLPMELRELTANRDEILFCLDVLRDLGNSLTIPVLTRYFHTAMASSNFDMFADAVRAITSFLGLRRGATGSTASIDEDYRDLMRQGARGLSQSNPLMTGLDAEANELPSIVELKQYLRHYLARAVRKDRLEREDWIRMFSQQPMYTYGRTVLCRFYLLTAAHNSTIDSQYPYLLKKADRPGAYTAYRTLDGWRNPNFASTEHVAPQDPSRWKDNDIYNDVYAIHTIGNLTLLPKEENSASGNDSWARKRLFFQACAADSIDEVEHRFKEAEAEGVAFGKKTKEMIKQSECLPILKAVSQAPTWNLEIIRARAENIAAKVWDEIAPWLDLDDP